MNAAACFIAWCVVEVPPGDAYRLPPVAALTEGRKFNSRYQAHLDRELEWSPNRACLLRAKAEALELYRVWDAAEGAHPQYPCDAGRKADYLRYLRLWMGRDAWNRMELPPCVPLHRFNELR